MTGTGGGGAVIVSGVLMDLVVSVSEVAVIVTVPPIGTMEGAAYVVASNVGVVSGLNVPQTLDPHETVQITPEFNGSLVTWALKLCVVLIGIDVGSLTAGSNATPTGDATMVRLALLLCDRLLVTVAVIVIEVLTGTWDGAV